MATNVETVVALSPDLMQLCELVASRDKVPVAELLTNGRDQSLLAKALAKGLMLIGRQTYTETITDVKPEKVSGNQVFDKETGRPVVKRTLKINVEQDWSWTGLPPGRKSLRELLDEEAAIVATDKTGEFPRLHVKITTDGMAAIG